MQSFNRSVAAIRLVLAALLAFECMEAGNAQTTPGKLSFAVPSHPGSMSLDQRGWKITELSAKEDGTEFGIRAEEGDDELLGFLYRATKRDGAAQTCRESMLKAEGMDKSDDAAEFAMMKSDSGVEIATVLIYLRSKTKLKEHVAGEAVTSPITRVRFRAFAGSGDLCGDIFFGFDPTSPEKQKAKIESFRADLRTLQFDPQSKPTFLDSFVYASACFDHFKGMGAVRGYRTALDRVGTSGDKKKWQGIIDQQIAMATGMIGGAKMLRSASLEATQREPDYPNPYLMLARVDALQGDAGGARTNLQQAFDRRANGLPGEIFPDPATDVRLAKLKADKDFWTFVEDLSQQMKKSSSK